MPPLIALTAGEPAGIGPDICLMAAARSFPASIVVIADRDLMRVRAKQLGLDIRINDFSPASPSHSPATAGVMMVLHHPLEEPTIPGKLNCANSQYVLNTLNTAVQGCIDSRFDAMVTAPVHKGVINDSGIYFTGHTEYLAEKTRTPQVVMMLVGGGLRIALTTSHLALREVPECITPQRIDAALHIVHKDLIERFGIKNPRILVAGLNPHAGETGYMGDEEIKIIMPVMKRLRAEGLNVIGPLPADTLFTPHQLKNGDCVLAMYHDQGLPVLKYASFGKGANITLGLPIIRTSVDHGTALDLAGTGKADPGSLLVAIEMAMEMAKKARSRA